MENDPPHWPYQLYVREAKRLVGDWVWTEHVPSEEKQQRSIGLGAYSFDCHWVSLYIEHPLKPEASDYVAAEGRVHEWSSSAASGKPYVAAEGRVNNGHNQQPERGVGQAPFEIPYDAMLPKKAQLRNVLVAVAASMSHIRFNAVRMEPTWMIMGHSAGTAAAMALLAAQKAGSAGQANVQTVKVTGVGGLQEALSAQQQKLWP